MAIDQKTLGERIFLESGGDSNAHAYFQIRQANSPKDILKEILALKLWTRDELWAKSDIVPLEYAFRRVFESLASTHWDIDAYLNWGNAYKPREIRERISNVALDAFFEIVFERDKNAFWNLMVDVGVCQEDEPERYFPRTLLTYLRYFAACNETAKDGQKSRIRKLLKTVLDEPLVPITERNKTISEWTSKARHTLACALVANGMYEECLDYNITEAYQPLLYKFLGGFQETGDGLVNLPSFVNVKLDTMEFNLPLSWNEALKKACEDKEWGHLFGVIIRMGLKHGHIQVQTPFAFMEYFSKRLSKAQYGFAIDANNLVLNFVDPPCMGK